MHTIEALFANGARLGSRTAWRYGSRTWSWAEAAALQPADVATLIYTSGTTGPPKAVMLSQRNLSYAAEVGIRIGRITEDDVLVSYLPLSHIAEQMISIHGPITHGGTVWFCDELE